MILTIVIIMVFIAAFILGMFIFEILSMGKTTRLGKKLSEILEELSKMENEAVIKELKQRITVLECDHNNIEFYSDRYLHPVYNIYGIKKCSDCGHILHRYENKKDFLLAKKELKNEELIKLTNEIKEEN